MPSVLVVDDSLSDRTLVKGLLADTIWSPRLVESAEEALEELKKSEPDIVLTDLVMPGMDGLQLVAELRLRYPHIASILLTGHGNEELAHRALREGAASYLSKDDLHAQLISTIDDVHSLQRIRPQRDALSRGITNVQFDFALENDLEVVSRLLDVVLPTMHVMALFDQTTRHNVAGALAEAVFNAMLHGNLELSRQEAAEARNAHRDAEPCDIVVERSSDPQFHDRRVHIRVQLSQAEVRFFARDEGTGFDPKSQGEQPSRGRGLVLMCSHMDEVTYNESGNEVTLTKTVP